MASSRIALLFLLLALLIPTSFKLSYAAESDDDDILIRQAVDHDDNNPLIINQNSLHKPAHHFSIFKHKFKKTYSTQEEHDYCFSVFKANLYRAIRHQKRDPSAVHGVTQFSDLTPKEFRNQFLDILDVKKFVSTSRLDEERIKSNLDKNGPVAVAVHAGSYMQTYVRGVSCPNICQTSTAKGLDHGALLVGYGGSDQAGEKAYWIIKNSWGPSWGEEGFFRVCRRRNLCGVESMVSVGAADDVTSTS